MTQGLTRVRTFCQDDSHIFVTLDQMPAEMDRFLDFIREVYDTFGFGEVKVGLGTRPEKFMGAIENWDKAERALAQAFEKRAATLAGWSYFVNHGDGAFYGPKLDFQVTDAIGRAWQLGTLQVDFSNPGAVRPPLHGRGRVEAAPGRPPPRHPRVDRAVLRHSRRAHGRRLPVLARAGAGARRPGLGEIQSNTEKRFFERLREAGLRATCDLRNEKLGAKIRAGELEKVPALLIVGEKEQGAGTVSLRVRHGKEEKDLKLENLIERMKSAVASRSLVWHESAGQPSSPSKKIS